MEGRGGGGDEVTHKQMVESRTTGGGGDQSTEGKKPQRSRATGARAHPLAGTRAGDRRIFRAGRAVEDAAPLHRWTRVHPARSHCSPHPGEAADVVISATTLAGTARGGPRTGSGRLARAGLRKNGARAPSSPPMAGGGCPRGLEAPVTHYWPDTVDACMYLHKFLVHTVFRRTEL